MLSGSRRLLVIDDDKFVRQSVLTYLEDSGFTVDGAVDGETGLALFRELQHDLVLTDLRMPGMDGLHLLGEIHKESPDTPVIVVSGVGVVNDVVKALRLGACDYLIKPIVDMEMLVHSVERSLERRDLKAENKRYREELEVANRELQAHLRVLEKDQQAGRQIQRHLLPRSPFCRNGWCAAHHIVPSLYLSGDFVDYAYIAKRYFAFYLADVSGHGASSAFATVLIKHVLNHIVRVGGLFNDASTFEQGVATAMRTVNEEVLGTRLDKHVTMFVGVIDTHTHEMRYSVGGHLPMPILLTEQGAEFLPGTGKPVGLFPGVEWDIERCTLPETFSLIAFSDGVLEILPDRELQNKEQHLLDLLSHCDGQLETIGELLGLERVDHAPDDISVMTITKGSQ